ncbi:hypothetical protein JW935_22910 [candidate division KSB1 bacterium]|nr:hypothetical protein [candidate division KSB1 bacterium]
MKTWVRVVMCREKNSGKHNVTFWKNGKMIGKMTVPPHSQWTVIDSKIRQGLIRNIV